MFRLHMQGLEAQGEVTIRHEIVEDDDGPRWHHSKIERVARVRQRFMDECTPNDYASAPGGDLVYVGPDETTPDALFMVDTDVILGPGVLDRLMAVDADVVYGVFWTECDWGTAPGVEYWPQVWSHHPYRFDEDTWAALCEPGVNEVEVRGGGACTLIRGRGFESRYWPLLESIRFEGGMWAGEDRSYCLGLEARGIRQVAVTGLPIEHLYTPEQVEAPLAGR